MYASDDTLASDFLNADDAPQQFVGFGPRLGAALLDFLFVLPILGASVYLTSVSPNLEGWLAITVLSLLYKPGCEKIFGATPGKMVLKLKVIGKEGAALSWGQAIMRYLPWLVGAAFAMYVQYMAFQIPGYYEAEGFMELSELMADYQAENGGATMQIVQVITGFLPLISAFFLFGNKQKQAAHDILAETYVISTKPAQ